MKSEEEIREAKEEAIYKANLEDKGSERQIMYLAILTTLEWVLGEDELWKDR